MSARKSGKNFLQAHWDWLVAAGGLASLALVVVFMGGEGDEAADDFRQAPGKEVAPVDMTVYEAASASFSNPAQLAAIDATKANFLAAGLTVFCSPGDPSLKGCGRPIPFPSDKCPYCGVLQKEEEKPTEDHDSDGMTDEWEKKYGFNPLDGADADADPDEDGFTNLEEFQAGTDPKDPKSHPDYLADLRLDPALNQKFTQLSFESAYKTPNGLKLTFKDPRFVKVNGSGSVSVKEGEEIRLDDVRSTRKGAKTVTTGFKVEKYEQKTRKVKIAGGMEKTVDASTVTLKRIADGKLVKLAIGARQTPVDTEAKLLFDRIAAKGTQEFSVVDGTEFEINGSKYKAEKIEKLEGNNFQVTVTSLATGEKRTIKALEQ